MSNIISGTFEITLTPVADAGFEDSGLNRLTLDKQFHGDLEATSVGQMLSVYGTVQGSAGYVAMEVVKGRLGGKKGTFALQHTGTMDRGEASLSVTVVPDSGTGDLEGLKGEMTIENTDGKHVYEFTYSIGSTCE